MIFRKLLFLFVFFSLCMAIHAETVPVNLSSWTKEGPSANGTWTVATGGNSVTQTINGNPTFFVNPTPFIDKSFEGTFRVNDTGDDDYIGFVFGWQSINDFYLFDWKKGLQNSSQPGFTLARVTGGAAAIPFDSHHLSKTGYQVLATDTGTGKGWAASTNYNFRLTYHSDSFKIEIQKPNQAYTTIFHYGGTYYSGKFGFYNYSQANVVYSGFTEEEVVAPEEPPPPPPPSSGMTASNTNFGNVRVGTSANATVTVTNSGQSGSTLTGTIGAASGSEFSPVSGTQSFTLTQGQSANRTYTYAPNARGTDSTPVVVNSDATNSTLTLTGTGVSPVYSSSVAPSTTIDFGSVEAYSYNEFVLRIENLTPDADLGSLTNLTLLSATISGIDASYFSIQNFTPGTVIGKNGYFDLVLRATNPEWRLAYKNAVLTIVTDQNAALGATGSAFSYDLRARMLPEPSSYMFLSIASILVCMYLRKR